MRFDRWLICFKDIRAKRAYRVVVVSVDLATPVALILLATLPLVSASLSVVLALALSGRHEIRHLSRVHQHGELLLAELIGVKHHLLLASEALGLHECRLLHSNLEV